MKAEEIRQRLHALIDELPAEVLEPLQEELAKHQEAVQRRQLLAKIIEEDAHLLKRLGR